MAIALISGIWLVLSTIYIVIIEDETAAVSVDLSVGAANGHDQQSQGQRSIANPSGNSNPSNSNNNNNNNKGWNNLRVVRAVVNTLGPVHGKYRGSVIILHIIFGFMYVIMCILFTRANSMFILELLTYLITLILGCIVYQYYQNSIINRNKVVNLQSLQICTQLFILSLGISGTRVLYALLGNLDFDFDNIASLSKKILALTFMCWFFLLYRTLEVIEFTMNKSHQEIRI